MVSPPVGRPALLSVTDRRAVADSVVRRDDLNAAKDTGVLVSSLHQAFPQFSRKQMDNHWHHTLKHDSVLSNRVNGEASSLARSGAINEFSQRAWFLTVKNVRTKLVDLSPGTYKGQTYSDLQKHFVVGCDEEGVQANFNGTRIVGRKGKKLHLTNSDDCRASATVLRTGSAAGVKGPSMYILAGSKPEPYITTDFLERNRAPRGSIYTVNPSAYMTDSTWDENVEAFADGIRKMDPVIENNPDWWVELHVDGFKSKVNTPFGQEVLRSRRILVVQSPSHSSHVTQGFDKDPAKASKGHQREWLPLIRDSIPGFKITDNHTLFLAMLASETAITGDTWKRGYSNVNLNPDTELPIEVWLSKIDAHLKASGEPHRLIQEGYSPSDEEVMLEHGKKHLRAIQIPILYEKMDEKDQRETMNLLSSPSFKWTTVEILSAPAALKLPVNSNLADMFRFVKAMEEAVELGVAEVGDLLPDWSQEKLNNQTLVSIRSKRDHAKPSVNDIGVSRHSDLSSFSLQVLPGESATDHFRRLCLARSRGGPLCLPTSLDLQTTKLRCTGTVPY
jgi:hypothetical protein